VAVFAYKGVDASGKSTSGLLDAENSRLARTRLRGDGVFLTELLEQTGVTTVEGAGSRNFKLPNFQRIPDLELALTTRQAATLIKAGITLVEALSALTEQAENMKLRSALGLARDRVNEGAHFGDALAQTEAFPELYVAMVRAGEASGALDTVLERLADYLESQVRLRNKVSSMLIYPSVMFLFALLVVGVLVTVVLPQISELLASLDQELPLATVIIIGFSDFARSWWWAMGILLVTIGIALRMVIATERGRDAFDALKLRLPVVGRTIRIIAIARFSKTLSTLLAGGLPITSALQTAGEVTNNTVLSRAINAARDAITEGASIAAPLRASGEFPPMVTHMIEVGERSGELEAMLGKVADTYEEQVETAVSRLTALLEPLLILLMVGIVIVIIMATLVPLLQVTSSIA
jgi:general secretion pathway protein F